MGSSASKAARKLPKRAETPSWAGARTPGPTDTPAPSSSRPRASERKTEAIEKDAQDPHFLANLSRLGPVRVDHHMQTVRAEAANTQRLFKSRAQSEFEATSTRPTRNRLHALTLSELLDARKAATSRRELERLAERYGIDFEKVESLTRCVNTPSVDARTAVKSVGKHGEEEVTIKAVWIEPSLQAPRIQ